MTLTVGIAGITGKFACRVVSHILKHPDVTLRGYCRDPSKVPESISTSEKVTLFKGDAFDKEAIHTFVQGCNLGDNKLMIDGQKILIDACEVLSVPRYIASDWALDYTKLKLGELSPKDPMVHVSAYRATKQKIRRSTPSAFGAREMKPGRELPYDNTADFTSAVARDPGATGTIRFLGGRTTIREITQSYEKLYGVKTNLERLGSLDDLYQFMHEKRAQNPADIYSYMSLFFYYYWVNGQTFVGPELDNDRYQVSPGKASQLGGLYEAVAFGAVAHFFFCA